MQHSNRPSFGGCDGGGGGSADSVECVDASTEAFLSLLGLFGSLAANDFAAASLTVVTGVSVGITRLPAGMVVVAVGMAAVTYFPEEDDGTTAHCIVL